MIGIDYAFNRNMIVSLNYVGSIYLFMKPAISGCIPIYNGKKQLGDCRDRVLSQAFFDFQVLVVDDRSTDDTLDIAQDY
jgi:hypothetical protein